MQYAMVCQNPYRTHTRGTHDLITVGISIPMKNPIKLAVQIAKLNGYGPSLEFYTYLVSLVY